MKSKSFSIMLIASVFLGQLYADSDTTSYKFSVGYDRGISVRFLPEKMISLGLIARPSCIDGLCDLSTLYTEDRVESDYTKYDKSVSHRNTKTKMKGAGAFLQIALIKNFSKVFSFSPYLEIGGEYATYRQRINGVDYSYIYNEYMKYENIKEKTGIGEIGIMPGFSFGRLSIQFKLGIGGKFAKKESDGNMSAYANNGDGKTKSIFMRYPTYDIINSVIVHVALF